jgi:hypothetical protein
MWSVQVRDPQNPGDEYAAYYKYRYSRDLMSGAIITVDQKKVRIRN